MTSLSKSRGGLDWLSSFLTGGILSDDDTADEPRDGVGELALEKDEEERDSDEGDEVTKRLLKKGRLFGFW